MDTSVSVSKDGQERLPKSAQTDEGGQVDRRPSLPGPSRQPQLRPAARRHRRGAASGQKRGTPSQDVPQNRACIMRDKKTHTGPVGPAESSRPLTGVRHPIRALATSPVIDNSTWRSQQRGRVRRVRARRRLTGRFALVLQSTLWELGAAMAWQQEHLGWVS